MELCLDYLAWICHPHIRTPFWINTRLLLIQHWMYMLSLYFSGHTRRVNTPCWYCADIHVIHKLRRHTENIWRASGLEIHRQIYVDYQNAVSNEIRKAKIHHYQDLLLDADQNAAIKAVNSLLKAIYLNCRTLILRITCATNFWIFLEIKL